MLASSDPVAMNLFYHQAVEDVSKGKIPSGEKLTQLRLLKAGGKKEEVCVCVCACVCVRACVRVCVRVVDVLLLKACNLYAYNHVVLLCTIFAVPGSSSLLTRLYCDRLPPLCV